jgi:hypothetical protein
MQVKWFLVKIIQFVFEVISLRTILNTNYIMRHCRIQLLNLKTLWPWVSTSKFKYHKLKFKWKFQYINHTKCDFPYRLNIKLTGRHMKWSSIWYINKILISIIVLETNIQKERKMHGDSSSLNQVFNMTTITSGNFNTKCDVDYSTAHILSYLVAGLND